MKYSHGEVYKHTLEYFNNDILATEVWINKYALQNKEGEYLERTPDDMHKRLAKEFSRIEARYSNPLTENEIYETLKNFKYIVPQGSPMSGIGNEHFVQSLGNCFVIEPPYDSYGGILKTDEHIVQLAKRRAGIGFNISNLRPKGLLTNNAAKTTDGIEVFLERYSNSIREVAQNGRRGAGICCISCHHPQILDFINIKRDRKKVTGMNLSVMFTDEFFAKLENDEKYELRFPVFPNADKYLVKAEIEAKQVWNQFIDAAYENGDPGILFIDTIHKNSPANSYKIIDEMWEETSTNPCGEIPMGVDSCRLLLLNLVSFVKNPFSDCSIFDFELFAHMAQIAQRLMDDLVDLELEKIEKIINKIANEDLEPLEIKSTELNLWNKFKKAAQDGRRTGLGQTGLGDVLAMLNLKYDSREAIDLTEEIYKCLEINSYKSSCKLAQERGTFPMFSREVEKDNEFINKVINSDFELKELYLKYGRRNIANTTTAPAGSVSICTKTTSGIEPVFQLKYKRRRKILNDSEAESKEICHVDELGDKWVEYDIKHHGYSVWETITGCKDVEKSPYYKSIAHDIDWKKSVEIQSVAQKWVCHSISKTINLPENVDKQVVSDCYLLGHKLGLKGMTVYRDNSRSNVLITKEDKFKQYNAPKRPRVLNCEIHRSTIKSQQWIILIGLMEEKPFEIFGGLAENIHIPKKLKVGKVVKRKRKTVRSLYDLYLGEGDDELIIKDFTKIFMNPEHESFTRMISLSLRHGANVKFVCEQLSKDEGSDMFSFNVVISRTLKKYIKNGESVSGFHKCPHCKNHLIYQEGCIMCMSCGFSKCS